MFLHPQLNASGHRLVLVGRTLSIIPARRALLKEPEFRVYWGYSFCLTRYLESFKAEKGQRILPITLGCILLGFRTLALQGWLSLSFKL